MCLLVLNLFLNGKGNCASNGLLRLLLQLLKKKKKKKLLLLMKLPKLILQLLKKKKLLRGNKTLQKMTSKAGKTRNMIDLPLGMESSIILL